MKRHAAKLLFQHREDLAGVAKATADLYCKLGGLIDILYPVSETPPEKAENTFA